MTSFPASRASQAREALSGLDVLNIVTEALMEGCEATLDDEGKCQFCAALEALRGCFVLTADEVEQVRVALANYKSPGLQELQVARRKAALALLSAGAGEATPT